MSLKDLFSKISIAKSLTNRTEESVGADVESVNYHDADIVKESRYLPPIDYSKPENFARYGSAKQYYGDAVRNIYKAYPYDGSLYERLSWENSSSYVDLYVFEERYPRTTGYINFSYGGWGDRDGSIVDGYGLPEDLEYISLYGGPHLKSTVPRTAPANIWSPADNRESNLELDLTNGTSVEFWLKKDAFDTTNNTGKEVIFDLWNYANSSSADYGRFRIDLTGSDDGTSPFLLTMMSGTMGFVDASAVTAAPKGVLFSGDSDITARLGGTRSAGTWNTALTNRRITFSAWVYKTADGGGSTPDRIFTLGNDDFRVAISHANRIQVYADTAGTNLNNRTNNNAISDNTWHHIVVTYDGNAATSPAETAIVYVDGVVKTLNSSYNTARNDWGTISTYGAFLGNDEEKDQAFTGYIDEVSVWKVVLSSAEVTALYNSGEPTNLGQRSDVSNIISWWRMGDGSRDTNSAIYDQIGTDHMTPAATTTLPTIQLDPAGLTYSSGLIPTNTFIAASVADGNWHHYAFTFKSASAGITSRFYVDGDFEQQLLLGTTGLNKVSGSMAAYIGALRTAPSGTTTPSTVTAGAGKLSGSLDEFRYWKTQRSSKDIGRYWFTQVGGGTNTDLANTDLGVYYKFNEGITGVESKDLTILDFSGRVTNGAWTRDATYYSAIRNTGSAIVSASAAATEFRDPILYPSHPEVQAVLTSLETSGSVYDHTNNSSLFGMFPTWIQEEDSKGGDELKNLTQICAMYFDSLQLQIENVNTIKDFGYVSGSDKPNIFSNRLLDARGLLSPELFLDADVLEKLADRSEDRLFVKSLTDIKSMIYQNIYNNLIHIYKSKGTEKSFRNLVRCFGIDEEVVKLSLYGDNIEYELRDNTTMAESRDRLIDFNHTDRFSSLVFQNASNANSNSVNYITGGAFLANGYAFTLEAEVLFPKKFAQASDLYSTQNFTEVSASIFGVHTAVDSEILFSDETTWNSLDRTNFQVFVARGAAGDNNARFVLSASSGGCITGSVLTSPLFEQVYDNSKWSLAVRVRPSTYPEMDFVTGSDATSHSWIVELYGVQYDADVILNEFSVSGSLLQSEVPDGFMTGSKRVYVGAHVENFTGSVLAKSDVKMAACRYWLDYLENDAIKAHARDVKNYGALHPYRSAYVFQDGKNNFEVPQIETLALNWDFEQVTGSDASGEFVVADFSSGSTALQTTRYGALGNILNAQHTGRGYGFPVSSVKVVDVDYLVSAKQNLPENLYAQDMIKVLTTQDDLEFTRESRPITFFFAFEKSMYQTISEEMLNIFGSIVDFNNLIGEPVNKYRPQYKRLGKLRELFFERVENTPDLDKYIEFYKWFDTSLGKMIEQLVPASADFADGIRIMVENHILARDKYQHKFPTLEMKPSDPIGPLLTVLPLSPGWKYAHHPILTPITGPPPTVLSQSVNATYWLQMAERYPKYAGMEGTTLNPVSSSVASVNHSRTMVLKATESVRNRKKSTPYRFTIENSFKKLRTIRSGVNYTRKKQRDVVYAATYPAGPRVPGTNIPANIMLAFGDDVEKWQNISDNLNPGVKRRLGFGMGFINKEPANSPYFTTNDGQLIAPFSLYSSSVNTGYNLQIVNRFTGSVQLTNLHTDVYGPDYEVPMQGPFTEKFVGGREHRHIELNVSSSRPHREGDPLGGGLDNADDRAEGFKLLLGLWTGGRIVPPATAAEVGALGIVGPQYPQEDSPAVSPPYLFNRPKANLKRNVGTKRPVNIKNILMTTGSLNQRMSGTIMHSRIGNYQKNYQIIQTAGRSINDPFFQDQSFDFALYPETLATRGRFPLQTPEVHSVYFGGETTDDRVLIGADTVWAAEIGGAGGSAKAFSLSAWVKVDPSISDNDRIFDFSNSDRRLYWDTGDSGRFEFTIAGSVDTGKVNTSTITTGVWMHIVATFEGDTTGAQKLYVNGTLDTNLVDTVSAPLEISGMECFIGARGTGVQDEWLGHICDAAVWRKELSQDHVTEIYNNGARLNLKQTVAAASGNLISWWKLGDNANDATDGSTSYSLGVNSLIDEVGAHNGTPESLPASAIQKTSPSFGNLTQNVGGNLEYTLPTRTGANSNQSIIVNRFNAPGGWDVSSRGYMDPAHEEKSVYNALPWRNRGVIDYGRTGSVPGDPSISGTIHVVDQIDYARGLNQRSTLHSGRFGVEVGVAASSSASGIRKYGLTQVAYSNLPSWNKMNRNPKRVIKEAPVGAGYFNGSTSYVEAGIASDWTSLVGGLGNAALPFSVSLWLRLPTLPGSSSKVWAFGVQRYMNIYSTGLLKFFGNNSSGVTVLNATALTTNRWYHVVITYNGGSDNGGDETATIYLNGVNDNDTVANSSTSGQIIKGLTIGSRDSGTANTNAYISNFAVWSKVLAAAEVKSLYNNGVVVNIKETLPTSLQAWYRFNSYAGDTNASVDNQMGLIGSSAASASLATDLVLQHAHAPKRFEALAAGGVSWPTYQTNTYDNAYVTHQIPQSDRQYAWITGSLLPTAKVYGYDGLTSYAYLQNSSSMFFDDTNDYIDIGTAVTWNSLIGGSGTSAKPFSISLWFNSADWSSYQQLIHFGIYGRALYTNSSDGIRFQIDGSDSNGRIKTGTAYLNDNQWHHVVATFEGGDPAGVSLGGMKLYLDGVDRTTSAGFQLDNPAAIATENGTIGVELDAPGGYFDGNIDEVAIWNTELSANQAEEAYNNGTAKNFKQHSAAASLLSWYRMGDGRGDSATMIIDQIGGHNGTVNGAVASDLSIDGSRYDGPFHYKLEDQFVSASDFGCTVRGPAGGAYPLWFPLYRWGATRKTVAAGGYPFYGPNFAGLNTVLKDPLTASQNTLGFPLNTDILSTLNGQQRVKLFYPSQSDAIETQYANRNAEDFGYIEGFIYDGTGEAAAGTYGQGAGTAQMFNALMLHRNGPYGWPTFRQIQAGPHSHPLVREQRKNNRLTVRTLPTIVNRATGVRGLKGNEIVSYIEPPIGSQHKVMTHTLVSTNRVVDNDRNVTFIDQSLIYNHSFANKVDYFANIELTNRYNLKLDTKRGDLYFNRLNELLLKDTAGNTENSPFENIDKVLVNYKQTVYPAAKNAGLNRNRRRVNYSISNIWNNNRTLRGYAGSQVDLPMSPTGAALNASIWPLDGHGYPSPGTTADTNFQDTLSSNPLSGSGLLQNCFSGFDQWGEGNITASCMYTQRCMIGISGAAGDGGAPTSFNTNNPRANFPGDAEYQVAEQAGKKPYLTYDQYCENLRLIGKDYSIVPEFRISEQMDYYLNTAAEDFWADNNSFLDLTGSSIADSSENNFFKVYSNSDFMRFFSVVDEAYDNKSLVNGDIMKKDKLALRCSGLVKFLPYKGFYPAERTIEISRLLSSSYGPFMKCTAAACGNDDEATSPDWAGGSRLPKRGGGRITSDFMETKAAFRAFVEPLAGPGILYNTIKSGIGVSNYILRSIWDGYIRDYLGHDVGRDVSYIARSQTKQIGGANCPRAGSDDFGEYYGWKGLLPLNPSASYSTLVDETGYYYYMHKLPFEALLHPVQHMSTRILAPIQVPAADDPNPAANYDNFNAGYIFDRGVGSGSISSSYGHLASNPTNPTLANCMNAVRWPGDGLKNYELAIDNFVCETVDFFQTGLKSFKSSREDQFREVKSGSVYGMKVSLNRTQQSIIGAASPAQTQLSKQVADTTIFTMYNRASGFGRPMSASFEGTANIPSWVHVTPPYYDGEAVATILFKPQYDGKPMLADIFSNSEITYQRSGEYLSPDASTNTIFLNDPDAKQRFAAMQISASVDLTREVTAIIANTTTATKRWLIQTKFETPVLNFAAVSASTPLTPTAAAHSGDLLATKGMWHQKGAICQGREGIFISLTDPGHIESSPNGDANYNVQSLLDVVGFSPVVKRIGSITDAKVVSEAVVAVPFTIALDGRRKFYRFSKHQRNGAIRILAGQQTQVQVKPDVLKICKALKDYVFPPKFDFVTTETGRETIDPFVMFVFEFTKKFSQQDLADIWQNLPPETSGESLQAREATIQHSLLAEDFFDSDQRQISEHMRWMVFKVKRRAKSNYNKYKATGLTDDLSTVPNSIDSPYTYNWPYDYFSLVELVKMDMGIQYASSESVEDVEAAQDLADQAAADAAQGALNLLG